MSALGWQRLLGLGSYRTVWTRLPKLHRAMARLGRDRLNEWVEVDETGAGEAELEGRGSRRGRLHLWPWL